MTRAIVILGMLGCAVFAACGGEDGTSPVIDPGDGGDYAAELDPADFVSEVDNPYWPLPAGKTWKYEGTSEGEVEHIEVTVTSDRKEILGIAAVVVRDTVTVDGELAEDTYDWYAQDRDGNVWYLGEDSTEYENGEAVSTGGSWEAGVDGAYPGIVMRAHPEVGDAYRQEYYPGEAEDMAEVIKVGASETVTAGSYQDVIVIKEWNPLEPDVVEEKYYAPDVGVILEKAVAGSDENVQLTEAS